ncbi:hypothetical protein CEXT_117131 [Caerostris extrusa]|uniref:Uncharacterized protein n=1 Tax=Caerostris extrusa TaxID=172846 RepID=A0AAV4QMC8_CAEEX|nr:hypothetical protein CEXT_117131 [Caerostris extrusa]
MGCYKYVPTKQSSTKSAHTFTAKLLRCIEGVHYEDSLSADKSALCLLNTPSRVKLSSVHELGNSHVVHFLGEAVTEPFGDESGIGLSV